MVSGNPGQSHIPDNFRVMVQRPGQQDVNRQDKHLDPLYKILGYRFIEPALAMQALTHPSLDGGNHYQRLEFVGDRVLGLAIAELLFKTYPNVKEGGLAVRLAALVRKEALADVAESIGLYPFIRMSSSAEDKSGRGREAILADVCEALIGAMFLDGGLDVAAKFVVKNWQDMLADKTTARKDAKSMLQEWVQGMGLPAPVYRKKDRTGPDHQPIFTVEVIVENHSPVEAKGSSKRAAEQAAAEAMLEMVQQK